MKNAPKSRLYIDTRLTLVAVVYSILTNTDSFLKNPRLLHENTHRSLVLESISFPPPPLLSNISFRYQWRGGKTAQRLCVENLCNANESHAAQSPMGARDEQFSKGRWRFRFRDRLHFGRFYGYFTTRCYESITKFPIS